MNKLSREELLEKICPTDAINDCCQGDCSYSCDKCDDVLNYLLDRYDEKVKTDAIEEFCNEIDIDKPMHFTKEQAAWIKKYVILKRHDAIDELVKEFDKSIKSEIRREYWWTDVVVRMKKIAERLKGGAE